MTDVTPSKAAPGWYPNPDDDAQDRLWDGDTWTDHTRARQPATAAVASPRPPRFAIAVTAFWLALAGLLLAGITAVVVLNVALLLAGLVLGIVAVTRSGRPKRMAVWAICLAAVGFVIVITAASGVRASSAYDQHSFQTGLAKQLAAKGDKVTDVKCPASPSFGEGTKFTCTATASGGSSVLIDITVQDNAGSYLWETR